MGLETSMQDLKRQMEKQLKHAETCWNMLKHAETCWNADDMLQCLRSPASRKVSAKSLLGSVRTWQVSLKTFVVLVMQFKMFKVMQMGLSENSVPLNPVVYDHYPY